MMTERSLNKASRERFPTDERRASVLGEIHARPFPLLQLPRAIVMLAFMHEDGGKRDHRILCDLSIRQGVPPPSADARTHSFVFGKGRVRWERHTEFSTYS